VPDRLYVNVQVGYAHFIEWVDGPAELKNHIEIALRKNQNKQLIDNTMEKMKRNLT